MSTGDIFVISVVLLSGVIALMRGFIREVLWVATWVGAGLITLWGFVYVRPLARDLIEHTLLADVVAGVLLFVVSLVVFSVISTAIGNVVRNGNLNAVDRSLGFVFGLARGIAVVALLYLAFAQWIWPAPDERPSWVHEARSLPLVEATANVLRGLAPAEFNGSTATAENAISRQVRQYQDAQRALRALSVPAGDVPVPEADTGYKTDARRDLERLIQSAQ